ncbi:MAG: hypothetical protein WEB57_03485 [Pseudohongiellaceae bacterium]
MSIMRSEYQVALQDLHSRILESVDHYRDSARFVEEEGAARLFRGIADDREAFASRVAEVVRKAGDLPAAPDADRETGEQLIHRLHAWFSSDQTQDVIEQRLDAEAELASWLVAQRGQSHSDVYRELLGELEQQTGEVRSRLRSL